MEDDALSANNSHIDSVSAPSLRAAARGSEKKRKRERRHASLSLSQPLPAALSLLCLCLSLLSLLPAALSLTPPLNSTHPPAPPLVASLSPAPLSLRAVEEEEALVMRTAIASLLQLTRLLIRSTSLLTRAGGDTLGGVVSALVKSLGGACNLLGELLRLSAQKLKEAQDTHRNRKRTRIGNNNGYSEREGGKCYQMEGEREGEREGEGEGGCLPPYSYPPSLSDSDPPLSPSPSPLLSPPLPPSKPLSVHVSEQLLHSSQLLQGVGRLLLWGGELGESLLLGVGEALEDSFRGLELLSLSSEKGLLGLLEVGEGGLGGGMGGMGVRRRPRGRRRRAEIEGGEGVEEVLRGVGEEEEEERERMKGGERAGSIALPVRYEQRERERKREEREQRRREREREKGRGEALIIVDVQDPLPFSPLLVPALSPEPLAPNPLPSPLPTPPSSLSPSFSRLYELDPQISRLYLERETTPLSSLLPTLPSLPSLPSFPSIPSLPSLLSLPFLSPLFPSQPHSPDPLSLLPLTLPLLLCLLLLCLPLCRGPRSPLSLLLLPLLLLLHTLYVNKVVQLTSLSLLHGQLKRGVERHTLPLPSSLPSSAPLSSPSLSPSLPPSLSKEGGKGRAGGSEGAIGERGEEGEGGEGEVWLNTLLSSLWAIDAPLSLPPLKGEKKKRGRRKRGKKGGSETGGLGAYLSSLSFDLLKDALSLLPPSVASLRLKAFSLGREAPYVQAVRSYWGRNASCLSLLDEAEGGEGGGMEGLGKGGEQGGLREGLAHGNNSNSTRERLRDLYEQLRGLYLYQHIHNNFHRPSPPSPPSSSSSSSPGSPQPPSSSSSQPPLPSGLSPSCDRLYLSVDYLFRSRDLDIQMTFRDQEHRTVLPDLSSVQIRGVSMRGTLDLSISLSQDYPFLLAAEMSFARIPDLDFKVSSFGGLPLSSIPLVYPAIASATTYLLKQFTAPYSTPLDLRHLICPSCDLPPSKSVQDLLHESTLLFGQILRDAWGRLSLQVQQIGERALQLLEQLRERVEGSGRKWFRKFLQLLQLLHEHREPASSASASASASAARV